MNLQKKLIQLSEYKCSFKYVESYFLVSVTYPQSWSVIPSEDRSIEVAEEGGVTFYAAPIETDIDKAFELIDETIAYNLDVEKKMNLLKFNINKLQELFATKELDELETLEFVTTAPNTVLQKSKKTTTKAKKTPKKASRKKSTVAKNIKQEVEKDIVDETINNEAQGDVLTESTNWGGFSDDCVDNSMYGDMELNATVEPIPTENKFLEEVER